ncbi:hypothetical protein K437DRAFT_264523 [Tilletiaria anomala UBC 951]|uniref:Uncharacterized protein n=1 Tax=Tilletiaria anomala (strain ATCC 24038 / CBS 436.72 / UBC 951) TaxID=1037660 RepID=A0A066VDS2_TILAU|nr:uncharacterized protein K437DRAFT_264523 [Tilletiaria anomala UBC 951]KDN39631.1 hypothetical protein K437DRAFT_264523 [Tilletiaria anomala UBC 951]
MGNYSVSGDLLSKSAYGLETAVPNDNGAETSNASEDAKWVPSAGWRRCSSVANLRTKDRQHVIALEEERSGATTCSLLVEHMQGSGGKERAAYQTAGLEIPALKGVALQALCAEKKQAKQADNPDAAKNAPKFAGSKPESLMLGAGAELSSTTLKGFGIAEPIPKMAQSNAAITDAPQWRQVSPADQSNEGIESLSDRGEQPSNGSPVFGADLRTQSYTFDRPS